MRVGDKERVHTVKVDTVKGVNGERKGRVNVGWVKKEGGKCGEKGMREGMNI